MAIALDQKLAQHLVGTTTTTFGGVTVTPGGSDRLLVVGVGLFTGGAAVPTITSVTYGGVAMTAAGTDSTVTFVRVALYYLVAPAAGTANVVVVTSAALALGASIVASSWTGVDQTSPVSGFNSAKNTSTTPSVAITSAVNSVVVDILTTTNMPGATIGAGQTLLANDNYASTGSQEAGAASVTMSWTKSTSGGWVIAGMSLKDSGATSPPITPPPSGGGTQATGVATIAEMRIQPYRAAPSGFSPASGATAITENNAAAFEASGQFPHILIGTINGSEIIFDDVYTLPSSAPAGAVAITGLPTANSLNASIVATTQDGLFLYPFPYGINNNIVANPRFATSGGNDLLNAFMPSQWDGGDSQYTLIGVHVVGENFTADRDSIAVAWCWDDTNAWNTETFAYQSDAYFKIETDNFGTKLSVEVSVIDSVSSDPIGPSIRGVISWVEERDIEPGTVPQPARTIPEVR